MTDNWRKRELFYGVDKIRVLRIYGWIIYRILLLLRKHGCVLKYFRTLLRVIFLEEKLKSLKMNKILIKSIRKLLKYSNNYL